MKTAADPGKNTLSVADAVAIVIGVVIGAGIFRTPSVVAASSGSEELLLLVWAAGGAVSLIGALCYAELASAFPNAGGEYHFMRRAFGGSSGFLFAWARMTVIQTGSIAMLAFLVGDYLTQVHRVGSFSSTFYAGVIIVGLTAVNLVGVRQGKWVQHLFLGSLILGLAVMIAVGFTFGQPMAAHAAAAAPAAPAGMALGKAMIFVLLTYGGWNEAAYLSAEVRETRRNMVRVLLYSIGAITLIYLAINLALLKSLGLASMSGSETVAADLMRLSFGENGARFISLLIALAAFSTMNATIITGARTNYALGRDFGLLRFLGRWRQAGSTPVNALLMQGAIALALVALGTGSRNGFEMMVEYTAPVFWFFFLLTGISLFVLRRREAATPRPFRVPLYPLTPILFCLVCLYMLYSSLTYTGLGSLVGIGVLLSGIPLLLLARSGRNRFSTKGEKP